MKKSQIKTIIRTIVKEVLEPHRFNEYSDQQTRMKTMKSRPEAALKLVYMWIKNGNIDYKEFESLMNDWADSGDTSQYGMSENAWQQDFDREEQDRMKNWKAEMGGNVSIQEEHAYKYGYRDGYNARGEGY
jgi:hypothetical protein